MKLGSEDKSQLNSKSRLQPLPSQKPLRKPHDSSNSKPKICKPSSFKKIKNHYALNNQAKKSQQNLLAKTTFTTAQDTTGFLSCLSTPKEKSI